MRRTTPSPTAGDRLGSLRDDRRRPRPRHVRARDHERCRPDRPRCADAEQAPAGDVLEPHKALLRPRLNFAEDMPAPKGTFSKVRSAEARSGAGSIRPRRACSSWSPGRCGRACEDGFYWGLIYEPRIEKKFPRAASCRISLSSVRSAIALRSRVFSVSRSFSRLT